MTPAPRLRVVKPDELPPASDVPAEAAVLSAVILDPAAMPKVRDFLRPDHFFVDAHRKIFEACVAVFEAREPIDAQTVASWLRQRDRLAIVGGVPAIADLLDASPVVANVRAHALAVHATWRRRRVDLVCGRAVAQSRGEIDDVQAFADGVIRQLATVARDNPLRPVETSAEALARIVAETLSPPAADEPEAPSDVRGFTSGIYGLDRIWWGLRPGAKTTVAAITGVGKTAIALQLAIRVAKAGGGVLVFSTELKRRELLRRALAAEACIPSEKIKRRALERLEAVALLEASKRLGALPLDIDETARITVEQIRATTAAHAERMMVERRVPLALVVVDYVQRLATSPSMYGRKPHEQIEHATTELKMLAQELPVAVLELAQAKGEDGGTRRRKRAPLSAEDGIAGSKRIAKEADEVIFLEPLEDDDAKADQEVAIRLAKQRDGRKGEVEVVFHRDVSTFEDLNDPMRCASRTYLDTLDLGPHAFSDLLGGSS